MSEQTMYGCINEDALSLSSPRMIEGDEVKSIDKAFEQALDMMRDGEAEQVAICQCKYYGDDGNGYWGEIPACGTIIMDASNIDWLSVDE